MSWGQKYLLFGNLCMVCFLETSVLKFVLLPYYRRFNSFTDMIHNYKNSVENVVRHCETFQYVSNKEFVVIL